MPDEARADSHDGVSRREVLKRAAIAGGVAWAAPMIQSITAPAFAQVSPICTGCFAVKVDGDGTCEDQNGTTFCPRCTLPTPKNPGGCGCGFQVNMEPCDPGTGEWTVILPPGCTFEGGYSKCGGPQDQLCQPAVDNGDGTVTFFPCTNPTPPPASQCISHIEFCFCCG